MEPRREISELLDRAELTLLNVLARCEQSDKAPPINVDDLSVPLKLAIELILQAEDVLCGIPTKKSLVRF